MIRHVAGYGVWIDRESGKVVREMDTARCVHCQQHIFVKPGTGCTVYLIPNADAATFHEEPGAWCRNCDAAICLACHDRGVCDHFMRQIERSELATAQRDALARAGRYVAGEPDPL